MFTTKEAKMLEERILNSEACFKGILEYVQKEGKEQSLDEVEKGIFSKLLELGQHLMGVFIANQGKGYTGTATTVEGNTEGGSETTVLNYHDDRSIEYLSIFGAIEIKRSYYYSKGHGGICPLDGDLNLPERKYSYLLQRWLSGYCVKGTYDEGIKDLEELLGVSVPKRSIQKIMQEVSEKTEAFWEQQPCPEGDAQILVISSDGKGVPMKESSEGESNPEGEAKAEAKASAESPKRLKKGQKRIKKKEALVGTIYTVSCERKDSEKELAGTRQVRAVNKEVYASLKGQEHVYNHLKKRALLRGLESKRRIGDVVFMADGKPCLWTQKETQFSGMVEILDFYHADEYLWEIAHLFCPEGSKEAEEWVTRREEKLKSGKVGYVIGGIKQMLTKGSRIHSQSKRDRLEKIIHYLERNRHRMRYDEYLALGYPIGTGAVEGACKNLVKERMEGTGMRWTVAGAEAVLQLRSVYLSHYWNDFWDYYTSAQKSIKKVA